MPSSSLLNLTLPQTSTIFLTGILLTLSLSLSFPISRYLLYSRNPHPPSSKDEDGEAIPAHDPINLVDKTSNADVTVGARMGDVGMSKEGRRSGIESTIGNTPLVLIRSLSEATGCEIWGKAEVGFLFLLYLTFSTLQSPWFFVRGKFMRKERDCFFEKNILQKWGRVWIRGSLISFEFWKGRL